MSTDNKDCKEECPNFHQDSILALEALLDIKRSPSLRPTKPGIGEASQISLLRPKTSNNESSNSIYKENPTETPKQSEVSSEQMGSHTDLRVHTQVNVEIGANESIKDGQIRKPSNFSVDTRTKITPNRVPTLNLRPNVLELSKKWILNENKQEKRPSLLLKKSHPRDRRNPHDEITFLKEKNPDFQKIPYGHVIKTSTQMNPMMSAPTTNWIQDARKVQSSVEAQALTSIEIPITGLVPNPLNPTPEQVVSSNLYNRKHNNNLSMLKTMDGKNTEKIPIIRATEVEAALRSKPQRGRKRENLTVLERLELTRTRNREHAKSTRVRKKARYQELLEHEKKFVAFEAKENLHRRRKASLTNLMKLRTKLLLNMTWPNDFNSLNFKKESDENSSATDNESNATSRNKGFNKTKNSSERMRTVSTGSSMQPLNVDDCNDQAAVENDDINLLPLHEAIQSVFYDPHRFQCSLQNTKPMNEKTKDYLGLDKLRDHDCAIRRQLLKRFGTNILSSIQFIIPDKYLDDIAFSANTAYVQYNVEASVPNRSNTVKTGRNTICLSGIIRARFFASSQKLTSLEIWSNVNSDVDCSNKSSIISNEIMYSFPSVVSLDNPWWDHTDGSSGHTHITLSKKK